MRKFSQWRRAENTCKYPKISLDSISNGYHNRLIGSANKPENKMKASKWIQPQTQQVRVYIETPETVRMNVKAYMIDDGAGYSDLIIQDAPTKKIEGNARVAVLKCFPSYSKFEVFLAAAAANEKPAAINKSYGSAWSNGFAAANGYDHDEA